MNGSVQTTSVARNGGSWFTEAANAASPQLDEFPPVTFFAHAPL